MSGLAPALSFLTALRANNTSEWFRANRPTYEATRVAFIAFVREVHQQLLSVDPMLRDVDPAKSLFRINRDIRFSHDKSPYKTHFGAVLAPGGPKDPGPVYYLHLEPGDCSGVAGGIWQPPADQLKRIRQEIDYDAATLRTLLANPSFTTAFGDSFFKAAALRRIPAGYPVDHPAADLLRLKSFTAWSAISDAQIASPDAVQLAADRLAQLQPLLGWLRVAHSAG